MKYAIVTFGCRVNQADSLQIEADLLARGGVPTASSQADIVIVNTCSVTASADQGARQAVRRIARDNPAARIVVTGCYATRDAEAIAALAPAVRVVSNADKDRLIRLIPLIAAELAVAPMEMTSADRFGDGDGACGARIEPGVAGRTAYTLRVQTGCNERCSYCIIPSTRGEGRSLPPEDVMSAVDRATAAGFKEIALTGVHLGSYGRDLSPPFSLLGLLRRLAAHPSDVLFRISSLEPHDCSEAIVDLVAHTGRFAPHFHLPLQHASDRMLEAMRRPYRFEYYSDLLARIRTAIPHASIGTDVIVGFPGERVEDFDRLDRYLPASPITHTHVFPYSDRPGTAASTLPGRVDGPIVRARGARVRAIGHELTSRFRESQVGTVRRALTLEDGQLAVTDNYLKVRIPPGCRRNEWIDVRIASAGDVMTGEIVRVH